MDNQTRKSKIQKKTFLLSKFIPTPKKEYPNHNPKWILVTKTQKPRMKNLTFWYPTRTKETLPKLNLNLTQTWLLLSEHITTPAAYGIDQRKKASNSHQLDDTTAKAEKKNRRPRALLGTGSNKTEAASVEMASILLVAEARNFEVMGLCMLYLS